MNAENVAKIALENKGRFDAHSFVEFYVMKAIKAAAFVGGRDCTVDLRGPAHDNRGEVQQVLKDLGYSVSEGMKYRGSSVITISWDGIMRRLENPDQLQVEPAQINYNIQMVDGQALQIGANLAVDNGALIVNGQGQLQYVVRGGAANANYQIRIPNGYEVNPNAVAGGPIQLNAAGAIPVQIDGQEE
jgi:hypothetical protein